MLIWGAHRETDMRRYLIYRTERKVQGRDIRLMGEPVANLPALPLIAEGGGVDLGVGIDVTTIDRVYAAEGFDPSKDLLSSQSTIQYLAAPTNPIGTRVTGLTAPDDTPVVVVYRDSKQGLQYTPWKNKPRIWTDEGLVGARTYYYRIIATREVKTSSGSIILHSPPSNLAAGRAVDLTPPEPPTITTIEWVRVGEDGAIYPYIDTVPEDEMRYPAVRLVWESPDPDLTCLVQVQTEPGGSYLNASGWFPRGKYEYVHKNEFIFQEHKYRLKVLNRAGNANTVYAAARIPVALYEEE